MTMTDHELLKADGTPTAKARRDMLKRLKPLGYLQFEAFLLQRTGKSMKAMAVELAISEEDFKVYHDACLIEKGIGPLKP